jgi:4-hydroxy-tetrahydrodipicolinate synthase
MTDADARIVVEHAVSAIDGRVPVIVGVSDPSLRRVESLGRFAQSLGCAGVLLQPLAGLSGDRSVAGYFQAAAEALGPDIPICVQDFPKANGVHLSLDAWRMTLEGCPSVVMLKLEDEPGLGKLSAIRAAEAAGMRTVTIFTGNNGIHLVQELARGSDGAMTGFAFPDVLVQVINLFRSGRTDEAEELFDRYLPVNRHELRTGIGVRKEILRRRGAIRTATARYPAQPLTDIDHAELDGLLARLDRVTGVPITEIRSV